MDAALFLQLKEIAQRVSLGGDGAPEADVLVDALIEAGMLDDHETRSREELRVAANEWAEKYALRRTGRTTRLLRQALETAAEGINVLVLAVDDEHATTMRKMLGELTPDVAFARVRVATTSEAHRDGSLFRAAVVMEDHYTQEARRRRARGATALR